jgi:two-component system cell cycle sensor histidine kinase/response regulator CckA
MATVTTPTTVLVVDDHAAARTVLARMLEEGGYTVDSAANGAEAIAKLAIDPSIDAVLTDVSMPDMTGVELAYYVRDHYPALGIAIVSGDVSDIERSVVARAGVPFLRKPVRAEALHAAIREAIRGTRQGLTEGPR